MHDDGASMQAWIRVGCWLGSFPPRTAAWCSAHWRSALTHVILLLEIPFYPRERKMSATALDHGFGLWTRVNEAMPDSVITLLSPTRDGWLRRPVHTRDSTINGTPNLDTSMLACLDTP